jgi:hypothetical protein
MRTPLEEYKSLIDGLVGVRQGVLAAWVRQRKFPAVEENAAISELCARLSDADREAIALFVQRARESGIHDTLAFLHDRIQIDGLRFVKGGAELPVEPFDTQLYYDWTCRAMGDDWPDEKKA